MKKTACFFLFVTVLSSAFSENPRWKQVGTRIPARADLEVRWASLPGQFPSKVWVYELLPNKFSAVVVSNLLNLCSLSEKDKLGDDLNGMIFQNSDGSRKLVISFSGNIHYEIPEQHSWRPNLASGVPEMGRLREMATNLLSQLHIGLSDVTGYFDDEKFNLSESGAIFFSNHQAITNIETRSIKFRRSVEGLPIVGGDGGSFVLGEKGQICKIDLEWHVLKRVKAARTLSKKLMIKSLRQGKAFQGPTPDNFGNIDWSHVKAVTIKKVWPSYYSGTTDLLYPYLALWTTVQTQQGEVDVEIDCPIIDEAKL